MNSPNNLLISLLHRYNLTLPKNAIEWRVVNPDGTGQIGHHFLHGQVTELLTDGVVSWFLLGDHETLFFGHGSNFERLEAERSEGQPKEKKVRLNLAVQADALND